MTQLDLIRYLAIGRPDIAPKGDPKHEILASILSRDDDPQAQTYRENAVKILGKSHKVDPGKRIRLTSDDYEIHVQAEHAPNGTVLLLVAITDTEFGVHHNVATFFQELTLKLNSTVPRNEWSEKKSRLTKRLDSVLSSLHQKYNTSSILEANKKVDAVKGVMHDNIQIAIQNTERIEEIDAKSQDLEQSSKEFHSKAKAVKCRFIKQRIKLIGVIALVIAIVLTIIIVSVVMKNKK